MHSLSMFTLIDPVFLSPASLSSNIQARTKFKPRFSMVVSAKRIMLAVIWLAACHGLAFESRVPGSEQAIVASPNAIRAASKSTATPAGWIQGVVTDFVTGKPCARVNVITARGSSAQTDLQGWFSFADLEPGWLFLEASQSNYMTHLQSVGVIAGQTNRVDFSFVPIPELQMACLPQDRLVISWPAFADAELQWTDQITLADSWRALTNLPTRAGDRNQLTIARNNQRSFYRVRLNIPPPATLVTASVTKVLDARGGTLELADGATLVFPVGSIQQSAEVSLRTLAEYGQDCIEGGQAHMITLPDDVTGAFTFSVVFGPGKLAEEVSVQMCDGATGEDQPIVSNYDPATGKATITVKLAAQARAGLMKPNRIGRWFLFLSSTESFYARTHEDHLIRMPYYGQEGPSCWAADVAMLIRAQIRETPARSTPEILWGVGAEDNDWGVYPPQMQSSVAAYLTQTTGVPVQVRYYRALSHMSWRLSRELDSNHPVILAVPGNLKDPRNDATMMDGHAMLVVGYQGSSEFIIHDSKDWFPVSFGESMMYTIRPWDWITSLRLSRMQQMQLLWLERAPKADRSLQTIGLPGGDYLGAQTSGVLHYGGLNPIGKEMRVAVFQFHPSADPGYRWVTPNASGVVESLPENGQWLDLKLPVWNAAEAPAKIRVRVRITDGTSIISEQSLSQTLPGSMPDNSVSKKAWLASFRFNASGFHRIDLGGPGGILGTFVQADLLNESDQVIDGWRVRGLAVSLTPRIATNSPASGNAGDVITILGSCFGSEKPPNASVTFNSVAASEFLSWSDSAIEVRVPTNAQSGEVVVITRPEPGYRSNGKLFTVIETANPLRISYLSGSYSSSTWQYQHRLGFTAGTPPYTVAWWAGDTQLAQDSYVSAQRISVYFNMTELADGFQEPFEPGGSAYYVIYAIVQDNTGQTATAEFIWDDNNNCNARVVTAP